MPFYILPSRCCPFCRRSSGEAAWFWQSSAGSTFLPGAGAALVLPACLPCPRWRFGVQGQLRAAVGLRRLKHVERAWYGVEQKRKRTRVFLLDYTGEQGYSAFDVTERVKRCYERLALSRPKDISEARRCNRVFFLVFDRLPQTAMEETRMNAIEWMEDDCDQGYPFGECTIRAYFELSSGRLYLPCFVSDQAVGDYRYCVLRIMAWLGV